MIHAKTNTFLTRRLAGGGFVGLLDEVPGAAFASSVRLLRADYSGGLVRVIAYDGSTQFGAADIMPYDTGSGFWIDLNSILENLDATATGRGLTTSDTLADLCSVGVNDYDGLTTTWYGQHAGVTLNATQANIANMPKIVNAGVLVTENGKPSLDFDGVDDFLIANKKVNVSNILTSSVQRILATSPNGISITWSEGANAQIYELWKFSATNFRLIHGGGTEVNIPINTNQILSSFASNSLGASFKINNSIVGGSFSNFSQTSDFNINLGRYSGVGLHAECKIQEAVCWEIDVVSDRDQVESNQNNAFSIYP